MLLAGISADKIPLFITIIAVLVVHYPLAIIGVSRLLKYKNKFLPSFLWHIIVQLLFVVGPIICILIHNKHSEIKIYKTKIASADNPDVVEEKEVTFADRADKD